jgi:2-phospho-L-lactate guanylyltransferase
MRRLGNDVTAAERAELGRVVATHVLEVVSAVGLIPLVVTSEPEVSRWADASGCTVLSDGGAGLDTACATGVEWASQREAPWLVLHADLPLVTTNDIVALVELVETGRSVIAPSSDGGTSALSSSVEIEFAFGVASFHRHLVRLDDPVVVIRAGLLHDLDTPNDLETARHRAPNLLNTG